MRALLALLLLLVLAWPVRAEAPDTSPRPLARPGQVATAEPDATPAVPHPKPRPVVAVSATVTAAAQVAVTAALQGPPAPAVVMLASSPRPQPRPKGQATPVAQAPAKRTGGSVCGDPDIVGVVLAPITSRTRGCGVPEPVQITMVDGISLSQVSTMDCPTALALKRWINEGVRPVFSNDPVVRFQVAAHYICRTRNNVRGAKISEHGRGRAIDIAAFVLASGKVLTVAANYGKQIRAVHKAACGIFGTTLGPGSDGYHEDHIHLDTAHYNNGSYCR